MVSALIDYDTRRWRADLIQSIFLPCEAKTILNIPISYNLPEDKIIWVANKKGLFSVKSAYYVALNMVDNSEEGENSCGDPRERLWKKVWHLNISSKIKIFTWRACVDALPTMVNLRKRGIGENVFCSCCGREVESIFHTIIKCEMAKGVSDYWEVQIVENGPRLCDISDIAMQILNKGTAQDLEIFFGVAWSIWGARMSLNKRQEARNCRWTPPPPRVFKVNVDGATSEDGRHSSVGAGNFSIAEVEPLVVETRILLARDMKITQVIIESDAATTVSNINEKFVDGGLGHLYQGILAVLSSFSS
nr:uncharacterized protein LOC112018352 [Quercus suber]